MNVTEQHGGRQDRLIREMDHDPYQSKRKLSEPTICTECGATFHDGRWSWDAPGDGDRHEALCPACQRVRDRVPAGFLTLGGEFLDSHRDEVMNLVHNIEAREKAAHPLKRIMAIEQDDEGTLITVTDPHLARAIGEALHHAYQGEFDYRYTEGEYLLRGTWRR